MKRIKSAQILLRIIASLKIYVNDAATLASVLPHVQAADVVGFDTEFTSFPLYRPKVCPQAVIFIVQLTHSCMPA